MEPLDEGNLPDHFKLAPSSSSIWLNCPGSLKVEKHDEPGEQAILGTLAHAKTNQRLTGRPLSFEEEAYYDSLSTYVQKLMEEQVSEIFKFVTALTYPVKIYEMKVPSDILEEHGGTVDFAGVNEDEIFVLDYKFGRLPVEIANNTQVGCYLNLIRQRYPRRKRFFGMIYQPYFGGFSNKHEFTAEFLQELEQRTIRASISDELKAGPHCRYCHLAPVCITAAKYVHDEIKGVDLTNIVSEVNGKPTELQVEKLSKLYRVYKLAERASQGAGDILKSWAKRGADLTNYGLGLRTMNKAVWRDDAQEVLERLGVPRESMVKETLLTPKQMAESLGMSDGVFRSDYRQAIDFREVDTLVFGKGGKTDFSEFD